MIVVWSLSDVCLFKTPMDCSTPVSPVLHYLPEFAQIHMSWWCYLTILSSASLYFCLQSFPTSGSFPVSRLFASGGQSIGTSASLSVLPIYSGLISFRIGWFYFLAIQGTLKSSAPQFDSINSSALSLLYSPVLTSICDYWKIHSYDCRSFVSKGLSLLFNTLYSW